MAAGSPGLEIIHVQAMQMSREEGTLKEMSVTHGCVCSRPKLAASFCGLQGVGPMAPSLMHTMHALSADGTLAWVMSLIP